MVLFKEEAEKFDVLAILIDEVLDKLNRWVADENVRASEIDEVDREENVEFLELRAMEDTADGQSTRKWIRNGDLQGDRVLSQV